MQNDSRLSPHPPEPLFEEYVFGRVSGDQCAVFEEHLLVCARCRDELTHTDEYIHLMRAAAAEFDLVSAGGRRPARRSRSRVAVLAAVAIITALAVGIPYRTQAPRVLVPVQLVSYRGGAEDAMAHARAGNGLDITVDCVDLGATDGLWLAIVDARGRPVWRGSAAAHAGSTLISARVEKSLAAGIYWVRLYSREDELLREFGLRAR
ncbi:MAG TPA: zf-HC2 domain-containing protein [Bryobacteraceae bacterium]|nr:zf-HC2 domain-containing protein [Bryobacteraceae bacterium]